MLNVHHMWVHSSDARGAEDGFPTVHTKYALPTVEMVLLVLPCLPDDVIRLILGYFSLDEHISLRTSCRAIHRLCHCPSDVLYFFNQLDNSYSEDMYTYPRIKALTYVNRTEYQRRGVSHVHLCIYETYVFRECF